MSQMIREHDSVALTRDIPEHGLVAGDVVLVGHIYEEGAAYEVEVFAVDGRTLDVISLPADALRPVKKPIPSFKSEVEAEAFVMDADLSEYDLSGAKAMRFEAARQTGRDKRAGKDE